MPLGRVPPFYCWVQNDFTLFVIGVVTKGVDVGADGILVEVLVLGLVHLEPRIAQVTAVLIVLVLVAVDGTGIQMLVALARELVENGAERVDAFFDAFDLFLFVPLGVRVLMKAGL